MAWYGIQHQSSWLIGPWEILIKIQISNYKLILVTDDWGISCEIALRLMSMDLVDD